MKFLINYRLAVCHVEQLNLIYMKSIKKIQVYILFITLVVLVNYSCKKDDSLSFLYSSTWKGTYTGSKDNGTWRVNIYSDGKVTGTAHSDVYYESYDLSGTMSADGKFYATFGTTSLGGSFTGKMTDNTISGTWVNNILGMSGNWSGSKI
jgi:hypothetical protein